jgi:hypothetical protein
MTNMVKKFVKIIVIPYSLPMLLSMPAWCHCDHCFCHSPCAVPVHIHVLTVRTPCKRRVHTVCVLRRRVRGALFVACVFGVTGVTGVFTLPTLVTQPFFFFDAIGRDGPAYFSQT